MCSWRIVKWISCPHQNKSLLYLLSRAPSQATLSIIMAALRSWTVIKKIVDSTGRGITVGYARETTAWFRLENMPAQSCLDDFVKKVEQEKMELPPKIRAGGLKVSVVCRKGQTQQLTQLGLLQRDRMQE